MPFKTQFWKPQLAAISPESLLKLTAVQKVWLSMSGDLYSQHVPRCCQYSWSKSHTMIVNSSGNQSVLDTVYTMVGSQKKQVSVSQFSSLIKCFLAVPSLLTSSYRLQTKLSKVQQRQEKSSGRKGLWTNHLQLYKRRDCTKYSLLRDDALVSIA